MANVSSNWQDSLNQGLVYRLSSPLRQPGMMKKAMSQGIINRCDRFLNRLPLLDQQILRWSSNNTYRSDVVPIIYAQPVSSAKGQGHGDAETRGHGERVIHQNQIGGLLGSREPLLPSTVPQNQSSVPVIQRKVDSSQANPSKLNHYTPSSDSSAKITSVNPSSTSEIPLVEPHTISEEITHTSEMPLQAEFIDSLTPTANPSLLNQYTLSRDRQDEITKLNPSSTSEIPLVEPQSISEEIIHTSEMPLLQELTNNSQQPLPIIQSKKQTSSLSPSSLTSLPIVTAQPLNAQINLTEEKRAYAINAPNYPNQSLPISSPLNQHNNKPSLTPLPEVRVTAGSNTPFKPQSLPLYTAKNSPSANSTSHQPNLSQQNPTASNTNSSSLPKIITSPSPPTETSVSPLANQANAKLNVDAIASQVERKLMRRLVIESERRGKMR